MRRLMMLVLATVFAATIGVGAQAPIDPNRFEPNIQKFEAQDKANPPVKGGIVFIGASSFARWTNLAESCTYVDLWPSMIGKDGTPKPELFVADGLHMTPEGYKAWTPMLRPHLK